MPASAPSSTVTQATPGVGRVPRSSTSAPAVHSPAMREPFSRSPEMRVSLPMVTRGFSPGCLSLASTCGRRQAHLIGQVRVQTRR